MPNLINLAPKKPEWPFLPSILIIQQVLVLCPGNKVNKDGGAACAAIYADGGYRMLAATAAPTIRGVSLGHNTIGFTEKGLTKMTRS